jgi:hypothetical protein
MGQRDRHLHRDGRPVISASHLQWERDKRPDTVRGRITNALLAGYNGGENPVIFDFRRQPQ